MLDIAEIKAEVAEIKWMVLELYARSMIPEPMIEIVVPTIHVDNIWAIPYRKRYCM